MRLKKASLLLFVSLFFATLIGAQTPMRIFYSNDFLGYLEPCG